MSLADANALDNSSTDPLTLLERLENAYGTEDIASEMLSHMCGKAKQKLKPTDLANKLKDVATSTSTDQKEDFIEEYRHKENGTKTVVYYARQDSSNLLREAAARFCGRTT